MLVDFDSFDSLIIVNSDQNLTSFAVAIDDDLESRIKLDGSFLLCFNQCNDTVPAYDIYPMGISHPTEPTITFDYSETRENYLVITVSIGRIRNKKIREKWSSTLRSY